MEALEFLCNIIYTRIKPATADLSPVVANTRIKKQIVEYDIKRK